VCEFSLCCPEKFTDSRIPCIRSILRDNCGPLIALSAKKGPSPRALGACSSPVRSQGWDARSRSGHLHGHALNRLVVCCSNFKLLILAIAVCGLQRWRWCACITSEKKDITQFRKKNRKGVLRYICRQTSQSVLYRHSVYSTYFCTKSCAPPPTALQQNNQTFCDIGSRYIKKIKKPQKKSYNLRNAQLKFNK